MKIKEEGLYMNLKSSIIIEYLNKYNINTENFLSSTKLVINGSKIAKRWYREEIQKILNDLEMLLSQKIELLELKNINIEECQKMGVIMRLIAQNVIEFKIEDSNIGDFDSYMSEISGKKRKKLFVIRKTIYKKF